MVLLFVVGLSVWVGFVLVFVVGVFSMWCFGVFWCGLVVMGLFARFGVLVDGSVSFYYIEWFGSVRLVCFRWVFVWRWVVVLLCLGLGW